MRLLLIRFLDLRHLVVIVEIGSRDIVFMSIILDSIDILIRFKDELRLDCRLTALEKTAEETFLDWRGRGIEEVGLGG